MCIIWVSVCCHRWSDLEILTLEHLSQFYEKIILDDTLNLILFHTLSVFSVQLQNRTEIKPFFPSLPVISLEVTNPSHIVGIPILVLLCLYEEGGFLIQIRFILQF